MEHIPNAPLFPEQEALLPFQGDTAEAVFPSKPHLYERIFKCCLFSSCGLGVFLGAIAAGPCSLLGLKNIVIGGGLGATAGTPCCWCSVAVIEAYKRCMRRI